MKGKELLENYPKIAKVIKEWFTTKMMESMSNADDIPEEFKNHMKERGVDDELLINVIDKNPSALFEIFDSLHVYIGIVIDQLPETEQVVFNYFICPKGKCLDTSPQEFFNRKDVEHYAMLAAIEYIDNNIDELNYKN